MRHLAQWLLINLCGNFAAKAIALIAHDRTWNIFSHDGYTPVIHLGQFLEKYALAVKKHERISLKKQIALGGMVPNLLRASKALPHDVVLKDLQHVRREFADKEMHVFGIGGTATLHIASLLKIDSVDSSGWRVRAARGIVQLLGRGDRSVADLGKWEGRKPNPQEWEELAACQQSSRKFQVASRKCSHD